MRVEETSISPENEQFLFNRWPQFFTSKNEPKKSAMNVGFACGDGWLNIVVDFCFELEVLFGNLGTEILQVKQKYGELRIAVSHDDEAIEDLVQAARQQSLHTCEVCGSPGELQRDERGWWATQCSPCRTAIAAKEENGSKGRITKGDFRR